MARKSFNPAHGRAPWRIYHLGKSFWFASEKDADDKLAEIHRGRPSGAMSARDVDEYFRAVEMLRGVPLIDAVRYYLEQHRTDRATKVVDAADTFFLHAEAAGTREKTNSGRRAFLKPFLRKFGDRWLQDITRNDVEDLLLEIQLGPPRQRHRKPHVHARNNSLRIFRQFLSWAADRGLITRDPTKEFDGRRAIELLATKPSKGLLTISETLQLLLVAKSNHPHILPAIALQVFAGIRSAEVERMSWVDVDFGRKLIRIRDDVAKTGDARTINWWPAALEIWLQKPKGAKADDPIVPRMRLRKKRSGTAVPDAPPYLPLKRALYRQLSLQGIEVPQNALRHGYATYGCAFHQSADKVKLQMGHSDDSSIFFTNYREFASEDDGRCFALGIGCPIHSG